MRFLIILIVGLVFASPGWYLVTLQLKYISSEESLFYRFILAAIFLEIVRRFIKEETPQKLDLKTWGMVLAQGIFLFGINFWLCYEASRHMISGLIPALPAIIFVPAMLIERLTSQNKIPFTKIIGSFFAVFGIFLLFYKAIMAIEISYLFGLMLVFFSIFFTLGGTQIAKTLVQKKEIPAFWVTSRALFFGGLFFSLTIFFGKGFSMFSIENEFVFSLLYLSIFVTGTLFFLHTYMVKNYGVSTASFLWTLLPAACLSVSAVFEGYVWTVSSILGITCIILGATLNYGMGSLARLAVRKVYH